MRRFAENVLLFLISTALCLCFAEYVCRQSFFPARNFYKGQKELYEYCPLLGWKKRTNVTYRRKTAEYSIEIRTNSLGLRGPELTDGAGYRLLFLGDSFAEAYSVDFEQSVSELTAGLIRKKDTVAVNGGTAGYSTDQELLFIRENAAVLKADYAILLFYDNDVWYNIRSRYWRGYKPLFNLVKNKLKLVYRPKMPDENNGFLRNTALYHLLVKNKYDTEAFSFSEEFERYIPEAPDTLLAWKLTEALLVELKREVEKSGSRFLLFFVPNKWSLFPETRAELKQRFGKKSETWDFEYTADRISSICRKNAIQFIEPLAEFRKDPEKYYFRNDGHWTESGNRLAARLIADCINRELEKDV